MTPRLHLLLVSCATCLCLEACGDDGANARNAHLDAGKAPDAASPDAGEGEPCAELGAAVGWMRGEPAEITASATPEAIATAAVPTWDLALDMMRSVTVKDAKNLAASPTSLYIALGMAYSRFEGQGCDERIGTVLRYPFEGEALHNALGASIVALEGLAREGDEEEGAIELSLRQSAWSFRGAPVEPQPIDAFYGSARHTVSGDLKAQRDLINCVIEDQSRGLLVDFLPDGHPKQDSESYDVNVTYLLAGWGFSMSPTMVPFAKDEGQPTQVPGMSAYGQSVDHFDGPAFEAVEVPFRDGLLTMLFVMPKADAQTGLAELQATVTAEALRSATRDANTVAANLRLPKFSVVPGTLDYDKRLGFECPLFTLRHVLHGANVEVDEKGVRAAAATVAETWDDGGGPTDIVDIFVDRPFLFFIHDPVTGYVLFSGRYSG